jgi:hypothetical protein
MPSQCFQTAKFQRDPMKPQSQQTAVDWTRAKGLLADLKSAALRSLAAQVLLGKELEFLKKSLGFAGSGRRPKEKPQVAVFNDPTTWQAWCKAELDISDDTANRWIKCFESALERAKRTNNKKARPEAVRLLQMPAAEMDGSEIQALAACVDRLVDRTTQQDLLRELGILKDTGLKGGDTSAFQQEYKPSPFDVMANALFSDIARKLDGVKKEILSTRHHTDYRLLLQELPLESPGPLSPSLQGIKRALEEVIQGDLAKIISDIDEAINRKMHGPAPKGARKSTTIRLR